MKPSVVLFIKVQHIELISAKECPSTFKHHQPSTNNYLTIHIQLSKHYQIQSAYCNNKQFNKSLKTNKGSISLQPLQHTAHCAKLQPQVKSHRPKRQCHHKGNFIYFPLSSRNCFTHMLSSFSILVSKLVSSLHQ